MSGNEDFPMPVVMVVNAPSRLEARLRVIRMMEAHVSLGHVAQWHEVSDEGHETDTELSQDMMALADRLRREGEDRGLPNMLVTATVQSLEVTARRLMKED